MVRGCGHGEENGDMRRVEFRSCKNEAVFGPKSQQSMSLGCRTGPRRVAVMTSAAANYYNVFIRAPVAFHQSYAAAGRALVICHHPLPQANGDTQEASTTFLLLHLSSHAPFLSMATLCITTPPLHNHSHHLTCPHPPQTLCLSARLSVRSTAPDPRQTGMPAGAACRRWRGRST